MKTIFALTVFTAGIYITFGAVAKDYATHLKAVGQKCKEAHKVDDDTYNAMVKMRKIPQSEEGKCMIACMMKEEGELKNGKFDFEAIKKSTALEWEDAAVVEKVNKAAKECVDRASSNDTECDMAAKLMTCFIEKAIKGGIPHSKVY